MVNILKEIFAKRNLIKELAIKDLKIRYSRPLLGIFWAFLSPLFMVAIFYVVFSLILQVKIKEAPFVLYLMSAVFPWNFFQESVTCSATSLIDNKNLIKEAKFPHYLIPLSIVLANMINFLPSLCILIVTSFIYFGGLPILVLFLPVVLAIHVIIATGIAILVSVLFVRWRDTKYILAVLLQALFYSTPVFYSIYLVRDSFGPIWFRIYACNPFVGVLNLYRVTILRDFYRTAEGAGLASLIAVPFAFAVAILFFGFYLYKKHKDTINDYLSY